MGVRRRGFVDRNANSSDVQTDSSDGIFEPPCAPPMRRCRDRFAAAPRSGSPLPVCEVDEAMCERRGELEGSDEVIGVVSGSGFGPRRPERRDLVIGVIAQLRGQSFSQVVVQILRCWWRRCAMRRPWCPPPVTSHETSLLSLEKAGGSAGPGDFLAERCGSGCGGSCGAGRSAGGPETRGPRRVSGRGRWATSVGFQGMRRLRTRPVPAAAETNRDPPTSHIRLASPRVIS